MNSPRPLVCHHTALERAGGAAGVARLLAAELDAARNGGFSAAFTWEVKGEGTLPCPSGMDELVRLGREGAILHLHASADWPELLERLAREFPDPAARPPLCLTLHDCRLLTGGCPYPLRCEMWLRGCPESCPRGFGPTPSVASRIQAALASLAPLAICPSRWMKDQAEARFPNLKTMVIPNGVAWPGRMPVRREARVRLRIPKAAGVALFVAHGGVQAGYKGGDRFERIFARIRRTRPHTVGFCIGGDAGGEKGGLIRLPYLERERLDEFLSAADVLVYPSLADNHPLIVLEAMAAGCPVAAWKAGGIPEQIAPGVTGILRPAGDEAGLADAVVGLLDHPARGRKLADTAFSRGLRHFTAGRMADDYAALYRRLLGPEALCPQV